MYEISAALVCRGLDISIEIFLRRLVFEAAPQGAKAAGYDRFFFVCHSAQGKLTLPREPRLHLFEGERLADAAVKNGLYDWLIERSG